MPNTQPAHARFTVYRLTLVSWADGTLTDFNLPRVLGYFATDALAFEARKRDIADRASEDNPDDRTTPADYIIEPVHVHTR